jgi:hypothetical protein
VKTDLLAPILQLLTGAAILLLGRRLFWLFVAVAGFLASFDLVPRLLPGCPEWLSLLVAVAAGGLGALLAVGLQYVAAALVGFVAGSYASVPLAALLGGAGASWIPLLGGISGALLMALLFDWTLIVLSALVGARAVLLAFGLDGAWAGATWLALAAVGAAFQATALAPAATPRRVKSRDPGGRRA